MLFPSHSDRSSRAKATRYVQAGRKLLNDEGVLPWTLWPDGIVPPDWSRSFELLVALSAWYGWVRASAGHILRLEEVRYRTIDAARRNDGKPALVVGDYGEHARRCLGALPRATDAAT